MYNLISIMLACFTALARMLHSAVVGTVQRFKRVVVFAVALFASSAALAAEVTTSVSIFGEFVYDDANYSLVSITPGLVLSALGIIFILYFVITLAMRGSNKTTVQAKRHA